MKILFIAIALLFVGFVTPPRATAQTNNSAVVPVSKLEEDHYDWFGRHDEILRIKQAVNPDIVFIGDSITHQWGGTPPSKPHPNPGEKVLKTMLGTYRTLNLGFGWDRTQNVLWRIDHGELDGLHPKAVVIHIGTNNTSGGHVRPNTAAEIAEGINAICEHVHAKVPKAKIILMAIFPREAKPDHPRRLLINATNKLLPVVAQEHNAILVDLAPKMLAPDGQLPRDIAKDLCHLTEKGYQIWVDALLPILAEIK
ncbi:MAG: GDSL-type esterase/lipase family protein [Kiritimatiellaeota bacterium]|nr:GDSL-type esterase/lipase family protein [Kiritimatiellota bacterium]